MIEQNTIFITGAASGIGLETARLFARRGWFVGMMDTNEPSLMKALGELGKDLCFAMAGDVTDAESFRTVLNSFASVTRGRLDVLFNNAGIIRFGMFEELAAEDFVRVVETNLLGVLNGIHCSIPILKSTPGARIISMASTSALYGIPELLVYSATKHAVCAITEALDIELERHGIRVSDIMAPYVKTPMILDAPQKPFSVSKMGVKVDASKVAATVWKASHGRKLHWKMGAATHFLSALFNMVPSLRRPIVKALTMDPAARDGSAVE